VTAHLAVIGAADAWSPRSEDGGGITLVGWFSARSSAHYTLDGTAVAAVVNRASGVEWTEATDRIEHSATGFNGKPSFVGTAAGRLISTEAAVLAALKNVDHTVIFAAQYPALPDGGGCVVGVGNSTGGSEDSSFFGRNIDDSVLCWYASRRESLTNVWSTAADHAADEDPHVHAWTFDGDHCEHREDGGSVDSALGGDLMLKSDDLTDADRVGLFCQPRQTVVGFLDGTAVPEILIWSGQLSEAAILRATTYLQRRWF
jgi:hypothetical protein